MDESQRKRAGAKDMEFARTTPGLLKRQAARDWGTRAAGRDTGASKKKGGRTHVRQQETRLRWQHPEHRRTEGQRAFLAECEEGQRPGEDRQRSSHRQFRQRQERRVEVKPYCFASGSMPKAARNGFPSPFHSANARAGLRCGGRTYQTPAPMHSSEISQQKRKNARPADRGHRRDT